MTDPLLTTADVADRLQVSETTVKRMKRRGDLAYVKVGWSTRYTEREISRYLRSRERRTGRAA